MKKLLCIVAVLSIFAAGLFAEEKAADSDSDWRESGKSALKAAGKFFNDLGSAVEESISDATEVKCYGTWVYKSENITTTFTCNKDGTMEISKKVNHDTDYWKGTFTSGLRTLTFDITESGRKSLFSKALNKDTDLCWSIFYKVVDEDQTIKITSFDIPTDIDGTDFSKGIIFTKK